MSDLDISCLKGYMRAAGIFTALGNNSAALVMTDQALQRLSPTDSSHAAVRNTLEAQRNLLEAHRKRTTCHVADLPVEILSLIFEYGSSREDPDICHPLPPIGTIDNTFVKRMSHVCRHWRQVAEGHAPLWQSLVLGRGKLERKAKAWGVRARGSIKEFVLLSPFSEELDSAALLHDSNLNKTLSHLLREPPVILRMEYAGKGSGLVRCRKWLETVFGPGAPKCTELAFYNNRYGDTTMEHAEEVFDWQGQSLERLLMNGAWMPWDRSSFEGLRSLVLRDTTHDATGLHDVIHFLARNSELEALALHGVGRPLDLPQDYSNAAITLDRLVSLEIGGTHWNVPQLLKWLVLPGLRTFVLEATRSSACTSLLALNRSAMPRNKLERLHLRRCAFNAGNLIRSLESLGGGLKTLEITGADGDLNNVIDGITSRLRLRPESTSMLCPNLVDVSFKSSRKLTGTPIKELVKSRLPTGSDPAAVGIRSLDLSDCPMVEPELIPWLRTKVPQVVYLFTRTMSTKEARRLLR